MGVLTQENFIEYAWNHYRNDDMLNHAEFTADLARIKFVKRLLSRMAKGTSLDKAALLNNHIKTIYNLFGIEPATIILLYRIDEPELQELLIFHMAQAKLGKKLNHMHEVHQDSGSH